MRDGDDLGPVTYSHDPSSFSMPYARGSGDSVNDSAKMSAEHGYCTQVARNRTKFNNIRS